MGTRQQESVEAMTNDNETQQESVEAMGTRQQMTNDN